MVDSGPNRADLGMNDSRLAELAAQFAYPPTPDIAAHERRRLASRRLASAGSQSRARRAGPNSRMRLLTGAVAALLLLLAVALFVPQTRAALLRILKIGAVSIQVDEEPLPPTVTPGRTLLDVAGATTLAEASEMVGFDILMPAYPADLGRPDQVYVQKLSDPGLDGPIAILVWLDPARPGETRLSLYQIPVPAYAFKRASMESVRETQVNGYAAFWVQGSHRLQLLDGSYDDNWFFVPGNALVWTDGQITYRLESGLTMEEAVRIGESLQPIE
jgi:hypothetical protein